MKNYSLGLYEKALPNQLSFVEKLRIARTAGYDYLEISIDESDEKLLRLLMSPQNRRELRAQIFDTLPVRSMCLSGQRKYPMGSLNSAIRTRSMQIMEDAIHLACDLGVQVIQLAGYDVYYEPSNADTKRHFEENLFRATHMAAANGVILAFETMETPFLNTVEKAMTFVNKVNSVYLQVYPDIGNITNALLGSGIHPAQDLSKGAGHLTSLHLKETRPNIYRDLNYGEGHVDFPEAIRAALALGVRRFVTEYWDDKASDYTARARKTSAMFQELLQSALQETRT